MKVTPIITCEHAGNLVPLRYQYLFEGAEEVLQSHRGWDPGALPIARNISDQLSAPLFKCETTRLLVEPNRSLTSSSHFSEYTRSLSDIEREDIIQHFYFQHRNEVESSIRKSNNVLHLSIHTFTPLLNGTVRSVDIGLLFDPARRNESLFCEAYIARLKLRLPSLCIEFNEPYKGIDDGFTTYLRTLFSDDSYMGIEIEVNQKHVGAKQQEAISSALADALEEYIT